MSAFVGLPVYVLMYSVEGDEWYRGICGISYNSETIEKMMPELEPKPGEWEEGDYYVDKVGQLMGELYRPAFELKEPINGECYIVVTGYASEMIEKYFGVFRDRQAAVDYATEVMSFEEVNPEFIHIINATVDKVAPGGGFAAECLEDLLEEMYY